MGLTIEAILYCDECGQKIMGWMSEGDADSIPCDISEAAEAASHCYDEESDAVLCDVCKPESDEVSWEEMKRQIDEECKEMRVRIFCLKQEMVFAGKTSGKVDADLYDLNFYARYDGDGIWWTWDSEFPSAVFANPEYVESLSDEDLRAFILSVYNDWRRFRKSK